LSPYQLSMDVVPHLSDGFLVYNMEGVYGQVTKMRPPPPVLYL
jgi:hypothetical protein